LFESFDGSSVYHPVDFIRFVEDEDTVDPPGSTGCNGHGSSSGSNARKPN